MHQAVLQSPTRRLAMPSNERRGRIATNAPSDVRFVEAAKMDDDSATPRLTNIRSWILGFAAVALLAGLGWSAAESRARVANLDWHDQLLRQCAQIATSINPELAQTLTFTASDLGTPAFECIRDQMKGYGRVVSNARRIYCVTKRDGRIVFGGDVDLGGEPAHETLAKPGDVYRDAPAALLESFQEERAFTDGPRNDSGGEYVSIYAPVLAPQTGELLMVVGLDVRTSDWNARVNAARRGPILVTIIIVLAVAGGLIAFRRWNWQRKPESLKLKAWIVVPTALAALAELAIFAAYQYRSSAEESRRNMLHFTDQMRTECDRYLHSEVQLLKTRSDRIAGNRAMIQAWQDRNLAALEKLAQPEFETLKQKCGITHFYFIAPDRTCLLRVHQPDRHGDRIDRSTMLMAEKLGGDSWGTELGTYGTCTLRYVKPWKHNGKTIGYLELGIEIGHLVAELARNMNAGIVTIIRKEYTTPESFEAGRREFGFAGRWDEYPDFVVGHRTAPQLSTPVLDWLTNHRAEACGIDVFDADHGKKHYACGLIHLLDAGGRDVIDLVVVRDATVQLAATRNDLFWSIGLASALIGGILVLLWSITAAAEKQLKDAFRDMRASRERFAHVAETSGEIIWEMDPEGLFTYMSHACKPLLGYDESELVGKAHFYDLHPEEGREEYRRRSLAVIHQRAPYKDLPSSILAKNGRVLLVLLNAFPILNADGTLQGYRGSVKDVTDQKRAEEALEKRIVALTQPLDDVEAIAFEDLFNLKDIQRLQDEFAEATGVASLILRPDGTPITAPSNFRPLCGDIIRKTEKGRANCRKSDRAVGQFHPEGPIIRPCLSSGLWDAGAAITVGGRHIASWLIGQVRDETQTEAMIAQYAREIGADEQAAVEAFHKTPVMPREQFEKVAKALFTVANQLSNAAYQNVQQARFITETKRAQDALLRTKAELQQYVTALELSNQALKEVNQLAEAATRAKSEFLANMSHEIRTPMTAIMGFADILLEGNIGRATRQHVEVIKRNGKHLLSIINDILDLSKVEAGKMQIEPTRCSPLDLLGDIVSLMRVRADEKHLTIETEVVYPMPETVLTDPLRLRQILVNLLGNAIKFTDEGSVRIQVRLVRDVDPPRLRIDVTDTGIGMNGEEVGRLFQAFSQVDSSATRKFGGSGMGLCISKRLAEALGGTIDVHSTPGQGSTFSVMIDPGSLNGVRMFQSERDAQIRAAAISSPPDGDTITLHSRVLLAEDGPDNQRLVSMLLTKAGAKVVAVENGQLALEAAMASYEAGEPFDVILMDMQMPVMDGYTATRRLREWGYSHPIVALTAHAMYQDCHKCLDAGCDDYATKPIDRQKLLSIVDRWTIRGSTHRNPFAHSEQGEETTEGDSDIVDTHPASDSTG
jgi:PAS domain S-box-containing protein